MKKDIYLSILLVIITALITGLCVYKYNEDKKKIDSLKCQNICHSYEYHVVCVDDSLVVYDAQHLKVGQVKSEGELDSLILADNL